MHIFQQRQGLSRGVAVMGSIAMVCHSIVAVQGVSVIGGLSLGFYKISALMFLAVTRLQMQGWRTSLGFL